MKACLGKKNRCIREMCAAAISTGGKGTVVYTMKRSVSNYPAEMSAALRPYQKLDIKILNV
jgi:hypothetical protein